MVDATLKTHCSFLENTLRGKVLNRFSTDLGILDNQV
jgi:hypothetical protein